MLHWMTTISIWMIPVLILGILLYGTLKRVPTYETFVEGERRNQHVLFPHPFPGGDACGNFSI